MFQKIGDKTHLYNKVVQQIKKAIIQGDFNSGDKLPTEKEMEQIFMVSRTIIREAVKSLEATGLVEVKHGYGIFVSDLKSLNYSLQSRNKKADVIHVMEIRMVLETQIAFWAATRASEEKLEEMAKIISSMEQCIRNSKSGFMENLDLHNKLFHMALAEATGNKRLVLVTDNLLKLMVENRAKSRSIPGSIIRSFEEHKRILSAVRARDPEKASKEMCNHLQNIEEDIRFFKNRLL